MKCKHRGFELEVKKERCLGGWDMVYRTAYLDGYELICDFTEETDVFDLMRCLKRQIDEIIDNPEEREFYIEEEDWNKIKEGVR